MHSGRANHGWAGTAFGLRLSSDFSLPGLRPAPAADPGDAPQTRIALAVPDSIEPLERSMRRERLSEKRADDGRPLATIDVDQAGSFQFDAAGHGRFRLSGDGALIECAPCSIEPWRWQRYLTGQVLPFASLLRGFEVFHASAVEHQGGAVAFIGDSGAGKSTLAFNLGPSCALVTDDVLAVDAEGPVVQAHPGFASLKLRPGAAHLLRSQPPAASVIARSEHELIVSAERATGPLPLRAVCFVIVHEDGPQARVERIEAPDASLLLQSTFNLVLETPRRLLNQLETCARISREVPAYLVQLPRQPDAEIAEQVLTSLGNFSKVAG